MKPELPPFEEMVDLARNRPDELEQLRNRVCESIINEAPVAIRQRLRGLQFQIDMERRRASNPMASCVRISQMMFDSLERLRRLLNDADPGLPVTGGGARVLSLETARSRKGSAGNPAGKP